MTPGRALGFTAAHNVNTNRTLSTFGEVYSFARFSHLHLGADLHFKWAGFSLISEILYRRADKDSVVDEKSGRREYSRSALGYFVQAGYLLRFPIELVARWGEIFPAAVADPNLARQREVGASLNFYLREHSLKLQGDYFYLFGEDRDIGTHQLRVQAQLFF